MTEKRFTMSKTEFDSEFGVGRFLLDNGKRMTYEEVVDLLNELWEKNEQLRVLLKEAEEEIKTLKQNNKDLLESLVEHESED